MDEAWQQTVDWLAREIGVYNNEHGGNRLFLDWGNHSIHCSDPQLKEALTRLAKDYLRLRKKELESQKKDAIIGAGI